MNSNLQNQRSRDLSKRLTDWLFTMMFGALFLSCLSGQVVAQTSVRAPAPSIPNGGKGLVDSGSYQTPASDVQSDRDVNFDRNRPLANLRQPDPSRLLTDKPAAEQVIGNTSYSTRQNHSEETLAVGWSQPNLRHRRLYFEDQNIERGNKQRQFPNFAAGTNFVKSLIAFPIRLVTGR